MVHINPDISYRDLNAIKFQLAPLSNKDSADLKALYNNDPTPMRQEAMSDNGYGERVNNWTPVGLTGMIVDKVASLLYARDVQRVVTNATLNAKLKDIYANKDSDFMRVAKLSSLAGYGVIRVRRNWAGEYIFDTFGLDDVFPILDALNPHGPVQGIIFEYFTDNPPFKFELDFGKIVHVIEIITRNVRDDQGRVVTPGIHKLFVEGKPVDLGFDNLNPLGDYLGAVWFRGTDHPFLATGKSDILPLMNTLNGINELLTDGRELMVWGIHSPIITNGKMQKSWLYSPRSVWPVDGDDVWVKRLESGTGNINDLSTLLEHMMNMLHQTSRIPSVSVGDLTGVGNLASGKAYRIAMTPALELIKEKEYAATIAERQLLKELTAKMLYYGDLPGGLSVQTVNNYNQGAEIIFAPLDLYEDETEVVKPQSPFEGEVE